MVWNHLRNLTGPKGVRCSKKAGVGSSRSDATSFLRRWVMLRFCVVHGPFAVDCFQLPKAASAISLWSPLAKVISIVWKFKSIQQHWWGDAAIHWFWQHPWYTRCIRCVHVRIRTSSSKHILHLYMFYIKFWLVPMWFRCLVLQKSNMSA